MLLKVPLSIIKQTNKQTGNQSSVAHVRLIMLRLLPTLQYNSCKSNYHMMTATTVPPTIGKLQEVESFINYFIYEIAVRVTFLVLKLLHFITKLTAMMIQLPVTYQSLVGPSWPSSYGS
jgi:hypothetical protein